MKLHWTIAVLTLTFFLPGCSAIADEEAEPERYKTPLTSIGAVSDFDLPKDADDPGIGGGFDQVSYFRNRYIPNLADCSDQIATTFKDWATDKGLVLPVQRSLPGDVLYHASGEELAGILEMTYRVNADRERARVTVFFYSRDGERHTPLGIKLFLEEWDIADLQDKLDAQIACKET